MNGWIDDPDIPFEIEVTCQECGEDIDLEHPRRGHEQCLTRSGRLPVDISVDNYSEEEEYEDEDAPDDDI